MSSPNVASVVAVAGTMVIIAGVTAMIAYSEGDRVGFDRGLDMITPKPVTTVVDKDGTVIRECTDLRPIECAKLETYELRTSEIDKPYYTTGTSTITCADCPTTTTITVRDAACLDGEVWDDIADACVADPKIAPTVLDTQWTPSYVLAGGFERPADYDNRGVATALAVDRLGRVTCAPEPMRRNHR